MFRSERQRGRRPRPGSHVLALGLVGVIMAGGLSLAADGDEANSTIGSVIVDASDGGVVYERAADQPQDPADATRLMALYLMFEALDSGKVRATDALPAEPGRPAATVDQAIRALAGGAPDGRTAALIRRTWGDETAFAAQMTQRARALGMAHSRFVNITGRADARQVTSARDVATLVWSLNRDFHHHASYLDGGRPGSDDGLVRRIPSVACMMSRDEGRTCAARAADAPGRKLIAVVLGAPPARTGDVRVLAAAGGEILRETLRGRELTLTQTLTAAPEPGTAAGQGLRIEVFNPNTAPATRDPATADASTLAMASDDQRFTLG